MTAPGRTANSARERMALPLTATNRAPARNDDARIVRARKRQGNWSHCRDETVCQMKFDFSWVMRTESQKKAKTREIAQKAALFLRQAMGATANEARVIP